MSAERYKARMADRGSARLVSHRKDAELAHAAATGDRQAACRLAVRLLDRVGVTLRCLVTEDPDLDDHVQEAMIEILSSCSAYRGESTLETWADRIAVRTAMRHVKKTRWRGRILSFLPEVEGYTEPTAEGEVQCHELRLHIERVMGALSPERRLIVTLRLVLGHTVEEVAELTGMGQHTVRNRLFLARRQLRARMRKDPLLKEWLTGVE